ncbi:uncharacterized protein Hap1MRO34_012535 [Clarias gariepinus]
MVWFKQIFGEMPHKVGESATYKDIKMSAEFETLGYKMETNDKAISLTIPHVKRDDGGLYYCEILSWENLTLSNGTFLAVTGERELNISVFQSSGLDSVPAGASVTLQCSVLSESRAAELQVLWFRAAPPQSHPQIIYTHHNSSHQCESGSSTHTCVYNFSKNILSLSDTGTYYCAVAACGKIIFGNGTQVQLERSPEFETFNPVVICLGSALVLCVILISVQAFYLCRRKICKQCREKITHEILKTETRNTQDHDSVELNYSSLHFSERKTTRMGDNQVKSQDSMYSEVKYSSIT